MLDIGASQGYYSFKAAYANPSSVFVMIEGNNHAYPMIGQQILDLCKANTELKNIILLNKQIVPTDLQRLSECEHFDVVLAMNIIHWFPKQWQQIANALLNMGDNIIIETPPVEHGIVDPYNNSIRKQIRDYLTSKKAIILGHVKRHTSNTMTTIYLVQSNKNFIERRTWIREKMKGKTHQIKSTFETKELTKKVDWPPNTYLTSEWKPGINLFTFKMYNGAYPLAKDIQNGIQQLKDIPQNDWMPNNMVIQGKKIVFIDTNDPNHNPGGKGGGKSYSKKLENKILEWVALKNQRDIINYFWQQIVKA